MALLLTFLLLSCSDKGASGDTAPIITDGGTDDSGPDGGTEGDAGADGGDGGDGGDSGDTGPPVVDWSLYTLTGDILQTSLTADGWSETTVVIGAVDKAAEPPPDGAILPLETTRGTIVDVQPAMEGEVVATFRAGTWPGTADLSVEGRALDGETQISLVPGRGASVQLHLHGSVSEGAGTMRGHTEQAALTGVDVLWWTDHDYSYYPGRYIEVTGYDFEGGALNEDFVVWPATEVHDLRWDHVTDELTTQSSAVTSAAARSGSYGWALSGANDGSSTVAASTWRVIVTPRVNFKALLAQVDFGFSFRPWTDADGAELFVTIPLSGRRAGNDSEYEDPYHRVHFVWSQQTYEDTAYDHYIPLTGTVGEWSDLSVDLSSIVESAFPDVGLDAHAELVDVTIRSASGATMQVDLDDFAWSQVAVGEELMDLQRDFLDTIDKPVEHLIGYEISLLPEGHLNAFGSGVPILPYDESETWDFTSATEMVHDYGGMVSLNHIFGVTGALYTEVDRLALIDEITEALLATDIYGCDLLEVGYRKRGGDLQDFLTVWDNLGIAGLYITGEGASDIHGKQDWARNDNNFVTWVVGDTPTEEQLIHNLLRGSAFFGDASVFPNGNADFELVAQDVEAGMGQVVVGATEIQRIRLVIEPVSAGWQVRFVEDGVVTEVWDVEPDESGRTDRLRFEASHAIDPVGGKLVRAEVWNSGNESASGLLFSNPIYFVDDAEGVPEARLPVP